MCSKIEHTRKLHLKTLLLGLFVPEFVPAKTGECGLGEDIKVQSLMKLRR